MLCANCGHANRPGQLTCTNCGQPLQASTHEGERKLVTVLFADIVASTSAAERLDPEDWHEVVSGIHNGVIQAVEQYGGTVVQLLGDGVLAFFGAPTAHEDDAERAVRAALDIQAFMADYRPGAAGLTEPLQMRIGLNTGLVVVGNMGAGRHTEYLAFGDSVNTAARIQSAAEPASVLISSDTYRLVKHVFDVKPLGEIEVKGRSASVLAYEVLAVKPVPGTARGLEGLDAPLVGRDAELDALQERVRALGLGQGAFGAIVGEAGIGKSRLIAELRKWSARQPGAEIQWIEGRSLSYAQSVSYFPWRQLIRSCIGAGDDDPPDVVRTKLHDHQAQAPGRIPFLEAVLAIESPESVRTMAAFEGSSLVGQITLAVSGYLRDLARAAPTVLVLDDLHWSDDASLDLLASLASLPVEVPLLIICLQRPDKEARGWRVLDQVRTQMGASWFELALEPLPPETSEELLEKLLPIRELPDHIHDLILARSEGNPFFLEEVLRALIDGGYIERENAHWRARREIAEVAIPDTLAGVLAARIDRLPENTKRVAQMAAVVGRIFAFRVLKAICDAAPVTERIPDLNPHLDTLTSEEILRERARQPELEFIFKHTLTQEAAYNSLLIKRRREYHRWAAQILEGLYAGRQDEYAPAIALHFWRAEEWERAAEHALRAGAASMKVFARNEALVHYEHALEAFEKLPEVPHERMIDTTFTWMGIAVELRSYEQQMKRLLRAEELARQHDDKRRLALTLNWIGNTHIAHGFWTRAYTPLSESYYLAGEIGDELVTVLPSWVMAWSMIDADPRAALARLENVIDLAHRHNNLQIEAHALAAKAMAHARLGESEAAERDTSAAIELAQRTGSILKIADVNLLAGYTYLDLGDAKRGLDYSQRGLEGAMEINALQCAASAFYCQGLGRLQTKETAEAMKAFAESVKLAERSTGEYLFVRGMQGFDAAAEQLANQGRAGLAIARYQAGDTAALKDIENALATARGLGDAYTSALVAETLGEIYITSGEPARAEEQLASALEYYRKNGMTPYVERTERLLGTARQGTVQTPSS